MLLVFTCVWEVAPVLLLLATVAVGPPRPALSRFSNIAARLLRSGGKKSRQRGNGRGAARAGGASQGRPGGPKRALFAGPDGSAGPWQPQAHRHGDMDGEGRGEEFNTDARADASHGGAPGNTSYSLREDSPGADSLGGYSSSEGMGEALLAGASEGSYGVRGQGTQGPASASRGVHSGRQSPSSMGGASEAWSADGGTDDAGTSFGCRQLAAGCCHLVHSIFCAGCCSD